MGNNGIKLSSSFYVHEHPDEGLMRKPFILITLDKWHLRATQVLWHTVFWTVSSIYTVTSNEKLIIVVEAPGSCVLYKSDSSRVRLFQRKVLFCAIDTFQKNSANTSAELVHNNINNIPFQNT